MISAATTTTLVFFSKLRKDASENAEEVLRPVAEQFESLFVQMMLKGMRDAVPEGGLFNKANLESYQQMHDSQLALSLSEKGGIGLADTIVKQLSSDKKMSLEGTKTLSPQGIALQSGLQSGNAANIERQNIAANEE